MAIISTDIKYRLSGGAANTDPSASLGGVISSTDAANYFDSLSSAEAAAGSIEYRCIYVYNNHPTLTMLGTKVFIQTQTPSPDTDVSIGLGAAAIGAAEQTVGSETTAPPGVTFSAPSTLAAGLLAGDIPPASFKSVWVRRNVNAGAAVFTDSFNIRAQCDTNP